MATQTRNESINLRVSRKEKSLIDWAAKQLAKSRSDFMLQSACREAEALLVDQTHFTIPAEKFQRFLKMLDESPVDNVKLRKLLESKVPWER